MTVAVEAIAGWAALNAGYITAAQMAIGAATALTTYAAQNQQAAEQRHANEVTAQNALTARNYQLQQLETRRLQERDAAAERIFDTRIQALEGSATSANIATARGVQGPTVEALANEYWARQGRAEAAITKSANNVEQQLAAEMQGAQASYENRVNSQPRTRGGSLAALGLGIGTAAANGLTAAVRSQTKGSTWNTSAATVTTTPRG